MLLVAVGKCEAACRSGPRAASHKTWERCTRDGNQPLRAPTGFRPALRRPSNGSRADCPCGARLRESSCPSSRPVLAIPRRMSKGPSAAKEQALHFIVFNVAGLGHYHQVKRLKLCFHHVWLFLPSALRNEDFQVRHSIALLKGIALHRAIPRISNAAVVHHRSRCFDWRTNRQANKPSINRGHFPAPAAAPRPLRTTKAATALRRLGSIGINNGTSSSRSSAGRLPSGATLGLVGGSFTHGSLIVPGN